jgi:hypothetical protein
MVRRDSVEPEKEVTSHRRLREKERESINNDWEGAATQSIKLTEEQGDSSNF